MVSSKTNERSEVLGVQYLRFLAALCVVYFHTGVLDSGFAWPTYSGRDFGACGVDLFFLISGFVMMIATAGRRVLWSDFLMRRFERIAPFYWGATLTAVVAGALYPHAMFDNTLDLSHILLSLAFLPHANATNGHISPFYGVGWTLNYEMYFYVVFAIFLALKSPGRRVVALVVWGLAATTFFLLVQPTTAIVRVYSNPAILEFIAGAALGWAYWRGFFARMPCFVASALFVGGMAVLLSNAVGEEERVYLQGTAAMATLAGALGFEAQQRIPRWRWALLLGDSTYAIYLVHPMVLTAFRIGARVAHLPVERLSVGAPLVVAMTLACVGAGVFVHLAIERPMLDWFRRERLRVERKAALAAEV